MPIVKDPKPHDHYDIVIDSNSDADPVYVHERDTIRWVNKSVFPIAFSVLPTCIESTGSVGPLYPGDSTQMIPIRDKTKGFRYYYYFDVSRSKKLELKVQGKGKGKVTPLSPHSGTIDVG